MEQTSRTMFVLGSGPGIGRSVASIFAENRYDKLALFARSSDKLKADAEAINKTASKRNVVIKTYSVDVMEIPALTRVLDQAEQDLGKPECVFYNAARVQPSQILIDDVSIVEYDLKINMTSLYAVTQRYIPHLLSLVGQGNARPALIVTSSLLPHHPNPYVFSLSIAKAAQRSFLESLEQTYRGKGILIGVINVQGAVSPETDGQNPQNIAEETWKWFDKWDRKTEGKERFEVIV